MYSEHRKDRDTDTDADTDVDVDTDTNTDTDPIVWIFFCEDLGGDFLLLFKSKFCRFRVFRIFLRFDVTNSCILDSRDEINKPCSRLPSHTSSPSSSPKVRGRNVIIEAAACLLFDVVIKISATMYALS